MVARKSSPLYSNLNFFRQNVAHYARKIIMLSKRKKITNTVLLCIGSALGQDDAARFGRDELQFSCQPQKIN
jgi:hypothetical protein